MNGSDWLVGIIVFGFVGLFGWARYCDDRDDKIDHREAARLKSWVWLILVIIFGCIYGGVRVYEIVVNKG